ncbi:hypothetical protein J6590_065064 [Homalodisca vitripennis]|nr:hypothetical protein J6590_065064 [Homalodisca vitripennis]
MRAATQRVQRRPPTARQRRFLYADSGTYSADYDGVMHLSTANSPKAIEVDPYYLLRCRLGGKPHS